ncbi:hypothetical protein [Williamsia sp. CHRR-6]|uniref:hypothetical protein n=1 Tax=Williamsia sp. CHRR-6 TaxID=2835871 RepID=UPI002025247B|nr:hypothetical protein [Williamsia sp. CHRR-6]
MDEVDHNAQRRRIAEIFGDDLVAVTRDEVGLASGGGPGDAADNASDQWLQENRPPHHG